MSDMTDNPEIAFAVARSHFIDAFSAVEAAVIKRLRALGIEPKAQFAQNLRSLASAKPSPQYAKLIKAEVDQCLQDLEHLRDLRCDIAHGQLTRITVNGAPAALFPNPQKSTRFAAQASIISLDRLKAARTELQALAAKIGPD
ncbi:hypothetical protein QQS45_11630 [Alteriqipengyuania flavescens]|uniref:hypothetical protein n=1 Tax=Alteriqipengyuania flavescens TaxID=3053610 RepID=UPI0025B6054F|nr:hypothetical protein [Alteriqipengyuania flavescens]WJY18263.1 hypothetical protein QQW98_11625 [Alteriqipengyuania flavescens]WJY24204.1 hypothetical protein QQS45_11630 [Alteriqipengyuania flavescens]